MVLINLTPHTIVVCKPDGSVLFGLEPAGEVARVVTAPDEVGSVSGVPIVRQSFCHIVGLPAPAKRTVYVVSTLVAQHAAQGGRSDVVAPDTSPDSAVRDADGQIVGVKRFQTFAGDAP